MLVSDASGFTVQPGKKSQRKFGRTKCPNDDATGQFAPNGAAVCVHPLGSFLYVYRKQARHAGPVKAWPFNFKFP
jgi:hypothetical protein